MHQEPLTFLYWTDKYVHIYRRNQGLYFYKFQFLQFLKMIHKHTHKFGHLKWAFNTLKNEITCLVS